VIAEAIEHTDAEVRASAINIFRQAGIALAEAMIRLNKGDGRKIVLNDPSVEKEFWNNVRGCRVFVLGGWLVKGGKNIIFSAVKEHLNQNGYSNFVLIEADKIPGLKGEVDYAGILGASLLVPQQTMYSENKENRDGGMDKPVILQVDKAFSARFQVLDKALLEGNDLAVKKECERIYQELSTYFMPRVALYQFLIELRGMDRSDDVEKVKKLLAGIDKKIIVSFYEREIGFSKVTGFIYYAGEIRLPSGVRTLSQIWQHIPEVFKAELEARKVNPETTELYFTNEDVGGINFTVMADPRELNLPFWIRNAGHINGSYMEA
jgi:hypothetical protein